MYAFIVLLLESLVDSKPKGIGDVLAILASCTELNGPLWTQSRKALVTFRHFAPCGRALQSPLWTQSRKALVTEMDVHDICMVIPGPLWTQSRKALVTQETDILATTLSKVPCGLKAERHW